MRKKYLIYIHHEGSEVNEVLFNTQLSIDLWMYIC